jgi:hypothetical protein
VIVCVNAAITPAPMLPDCRRKEGPPAA